MLGLSLLVVILILSFALCIYIEIKFLSPVVIFWIALLGLFVLPHLIHCFLSHSVDQSTLIKSTIYVSLFNFIYFVTKLIIISITRKDKFNWVFNNLENAKNDRINRLLTILYLAGLLFWIFGIILAGFNLFSSRWADTLNVKSVFSQVGNTLIFASTGIILYNFILKDRFKFLLVVILALVCIIILRARIMLIALVVPFVFLILYRNNKINIRLKFVLLILVFTFSVFFLQAFRWAGGISDFSFNKIPKYIDTSVKNMSGPHGEFHLVTEFYKIIEDDNHAKNFGQGRTYWRLALFWLPSSLLPDNLKFIKPRDFPIDIYNMIYNTPNNTRGTTHPTFYGDLFANFGWFGIIMAVFWAFVNEFIDQICKRNQSKLVFLLGNISTFYIMLARGAVYNASFFMITAIIIVSIMFYKYKIGKQILF